jgi:hypothetical protein
LIVTVTVLVKNSWMVTVSVLVVVAVTVVVTVVGQIMPEVVEIGAVVMVARGRRRGAALGLGRLRERIGL